MSTPEGLILAQVLEYLKARGVYAWRNNTGAVRLEGRSGSRFVRYGMKGSADILGVLDDGRFLAIECKAPAGRVTPEQSCFLGEIRARGGVAIVARCAEDVERELYHPDAWILQKRRVAST